MPSIQETGRTIEKTPPASLRVVNLEGNPGLPLLKITSPDQKAPKKTAGEIFRQVSRNVGKIFAHESPTDYSERDW